VFKLSDPNHILILMFEASARADTTSPAESIRTHPVAGAAGTRTRPIHRMYRSPTGHRARTLTTVNPEKPPGSTKDQKRSAAFFDLDKTVIARSSTLAFSRPFYAGGLISRASMLRSAYAHFFYQASGADHDQMERMRQYLSRMVVGWDVQTVRAIVADTLAELIAPLVYEEATALIAEHHEAGRDVVIVSASGADVVEPIGAMLGADIVVATRMVIDEGRYTGEIEFYAYGENKAQAITTLAEVYGYDLGDCYAYSDSITDLPMLEVVGHPSAVNPDRPLRREAVARAWPVLDFHRPVSLHSRFPSGAAARAAALGAGPRAKELAAEIGGGAVVVALGAGAAATAGIVWFASRRRERHAV
jgi:HAD superfamily hydrolase (TIGR01490 family)